MTRDEAERFLAAACVRHGGVDTFSRTSRLAVRLLDLRGLVPRLKGLGRTFPAPGAVDLWPNERRAVFFDYPHPGEVGIFDRGCVAVTTDAAVRLDGPSHRPTFDSRARWRTWWKEDALYFFGYALLDYVSLPYLLRHQEMIEARRGAAGIELWFRFPDGAHTHSRQQGFFFDHSGLLYRHDYRAEIMGKVFNGAHEGREHRDFEGLLIATERTVYAKPWHYPVRLRLPVPVLAARLLPRDDRPFGPSHAGAGSATVEPRPAPTAPRRSVSRSYVDS
jgi:hypothetical protein